MSAPEHGQSRRDRLLRGGRDVCNVFPVAERTDSAVALHGKDDSLQFHLPGNDHAKAWVCEGVAGWIGWMSRREDSEKLPKVSGEILPTVGSLLWGLWCGLLFVNSIVCLVC